MKKIFLVILVCLISASTVGFFHGRESVLNEGDQQKLIAASRATVQMVDGRAYISLSLEDGAQSWVCDVEENTVRFLDPNLRTKFLESKPFRINTKILDGFIGGTAAWKVTDVIKDLRAISARGSNNPRVLIETIAYMASSISGYYFGRYLGVEITRRYMSEELGPILEDPLACKEIKSLFVALMYRESIDRMRTKILQISSGKHQSEQNYSHSELIETLKKLGDPSVDFKTRDFQHLIYLSQ